ncbi:hypothetical protein TNIN_183141 [Trichonephila inaurata madagascariensis]|uniref:Uncharacterized protein n=1 Tax=Trichonephila inaurata madagascariensis TaxID=2747483 RepID=A0A8X6MA57_9ARAC|nr:hypothetical protein TNIN_183141 [Trichonephila inaurata madagascariensis]
MAQMRVWFLEVFLTGLKVVKEAKRQKEDTKRMCFTAAMDHTGLKSKRKKSLRVLSEQLPCNPASFSEGSIILDLTYILNTQRSIQARILRVVGP